MSSLDEVFEQLRLFQRALLEFNQEVGTSAAALAKSHDELTGLWRDEAALRYQQAYEPLAHSLDDYLRAGAPRFEHFLDNKVRQLERYLHGA
jgi:hypothetical protein